MKKVVVKFGGSSLANANQIEKVINILNEKQERKYIITSAPGKYDAGDEKVTDMLISLYESFKNDDKEQIDVLVEKIKNRYINIIKGLNIIFDIDAEIEEIINHSKNKLSRDYLASRGEYLNAKILTCKLDGIFLDMKNVIIFEDDGSTNYDLTYGNILREIKKIEKENSNKKIIIPGFYGSTRDGDIKTFSRGGSDITGSLVARAITADIYENWTDVSGVLWTDPRLVENPVNIDYITYTELRELSYMGASVLHQDAIHPVSKAGIPINILNTNKPTDAGTMIVSNLPVIVKRKTVTGVAGKKGFSSIMLQKSLMNNQVGFVAKLLKIFEEEKISIEHCPTGVDTISIIYKTEDLVEKKENILNKIKKNLNPDLLTVEDNLAIIAIVGEGMIYSKKVTADVFVALSENEIGVKMIDQGSSGINIIIGVAEDDYEKSIKALYEKLH